MYADAKRALREAWPRIGEKRRAAIVAAWALDAPYITLGTPFQRGCRTRKELRDASANPFALVGVK